jgi:hypothetical protein
MKMKFFITLMMFFVCFHVQLLAQETKAETKTEPKPTFTVGFDGQIAATTNGTYSFLNFGGPSLRMNAKPFVFSINMFPSLSFYDNPARPFVTPSLGFGCQIAYKKFILCLPLYLVRDKATLPEYWIFTAGIGYKFGK